jgi:hypothetical protein
MLTFEGRPNLLPLELRSLIAVGASLVPEDTSVGGALLFF